MKRPIMPMPARLLRVAVLATALGAVGACGTVDNRGNLPAKERIAAVKAGTTTKGEVLRLLGSPSTQAALDRNTWYYISKREQRFAFLHPRVEDQQVIEIKFDQAGVVQAVRRYGLKDAQSVRYTARQTPTTKREPGLIRSLYETLTRGPLRPRPGATQGVER